MAKKTANRSGQKKGQHGTSYSPTGGAQAEGQHRQFMGAPMNALTNGSYHEKLRTAPSNKGVVVSLDIPNAMFIENGGGFTGYDTAETNAWVTRWAAGDTAIKTLAIRLPREYSQTGDVCKLGLLTEMGGSTDTPVLDAAVYRKRPGSALSTDLDPTASDAASDTSAWLYIDASSKSNKAGDVLFFDITPGTHGTDTVNVYAAELMFSSCLVPYDRDLRA